MARLGDSDEGHLIDEPGDASGMFSQVLEPPPRAASTAHVGAGGGAGAGGGGGAATMPAAEPVLAAATGAFDGAVTAASAQEAASAVQDEAAVMSPVDAGRTAKPLLGTPRAAAAAAAEDDSEAHVRRTNSGRPRRRDGWLSPLTAAATRSVDSLPQHGRPVRGAEEHGVRREPVALLLEALGLRDHDVVVVHGDSDPVRALWAWPWGEGRERAAHWRRGVTCWERSFEVAFTVPHIGTMFVLNRIVDSIFFLVRGVWRWRASALVMRGLRLAGHDH